MSHYHTEGQGQGRKENNICGAELKWNNICGTELKQYTWCRAGTKKTRR